MRGGYSNKKVLVCGMAKSGQSAALLLSKRGARVTAQDIKPHDAIDWTFLPEEENVELFLGQNPDAIVGAFDLIVISPGIPVSLPFVKKAETLGVKVIGEVELAYSLCECPVIAITGTNGKTTVTTLVGEIMRRHNPKTAVAGNIGAPFTGAVLNLDKDSLVVAEISSFQLETAVNFKPLISAVLNITPDHLDRHRTMEEYAALKARIFKNQREGYAVLNYDDARCRAMRPECETVFFSVRETLEKGVYIEKGVIRARLSGEILNITETAKLRVLPENAAAAAAVCLCAGAPVRLIAETLENFKGVEHRVEYVTEIDGAAYFNDSKATNVESAVKGLEAMNGPVIVIGGGYDKKADFSAWAAAMNGKVKHLVLMGETAEQIMSACDAEGFNRYERVNSLRDAVAVASAKAAPGDSVLLSPACASWDMFDNYEQRGRLFKEFVYELKDGGGTNV